MVGALSPEWVAHTGYKGKGQEIIPQKEEEIPKDDVDLWRRSLSETINLLRNEKPHFASNTVSTSSQANL